MRQNQTRVAIALMVILVSPMFNLMIDVQASGSLETSISNDSGFHTSTNQLHVRDSVNLTFSVSANSAQFTSGNYSYSGVINGNGTYNNNSPLQLNSTQSGNVTLTYAAYGPNVTESNKSLVIVFDIDEPTISISNINSSQISLTPSQPQLANITMSKTGNVLLSCSDTINDIQTIQILDQSGSVLSENNSSTLVVTGSVFTSNVTQTVYTHCTDKVGNTVNESLSIYVDNTPPAFTLLHPSIQGQCLPPSWSLSYSSSDPTTPINHYYSLNSSGTWSQLQQPFQPSQGFSGTLHLKSSTGLVIQT